MRKIINFPGSFSLLHLPCNLGRAPAPGNKNQEREAVAALSLEVFKVRLDVAQSNLVQKKVSLPLAGVETRTSLRSLPTQSILCTHTENRDFLTEQLGDGELVSSSVEMIPVGDSAFCTRSGHFQANIEPKLNIALPQKILLSAASIPHSLQNPDILCHLFATV